MSEKERLDTLLVEKKLAHSREFAKSIIMSGKVFVNGQICDKAGTKIASDSVIEVKAEKLPYVSRGGLKIEKAIKEFGLDLCEKICLDAGASTGGFTDAMLQNGAKKVYAVDVGYGQFDWRLRNDQRVSLFERTNIRYMDWTTLGEKCNFAAADLSFISLEKVLSPISNLLLEDGEIVCLIKPQFEAGRDKVGKKGVVRDFKVHSEVIKRVLTYANSIGLFASKLTYSPITGPNGNVEYLVLLKKEEYDIDDDIDKVVNEAKNHLVLNGSNDNE